MFNQLTKLLFVLLLILSVVLCLQWGRITHLAAKNQKQVQTIEQLTLTQQRLNDMLVQERRAIREQLAIEQSHKVKANEDIKIIYQTLSSDHCANARLPDDVIKRLQYNEN